MNYKTFIENITFSGIDPLEPGIILLCGNSENPLCTNADLHLTKLPFDDDIFKDILRDICTIPRMSTFAIGAIINNIVSNLPENLCYVNVGVWQGFTFLSGIINNRTKRCIGVDNFSQFGGPKNQFIERFNTIKSDNHEFYDMDYRQYFASTHQGNIGFYIYDGNHAKEHQLEGLRCAEPYLAKGAYLLIDDINLDGPIEGTLEFIKQSSHKYHLIIEKHTAHNSHPTFWNGIALIQKLT